MRRGLSARFGAAWKPLAFAALATLALVVPGVAIPTMLIVQRGTHDSLIAEDGLYRTLVLTN